jgi:hypothetical protein
LNLVGIFLLRLIKDMKDIGIDDLTLKAFQDAGVPDIEAYFPAPEERQSLYRRRSNVTLGYSLGILVLSVALTLTGLVAALWQHSVVDRHGSRIYGHFLCSPRHRRNRPFTTA